MNMNNKKKKKKDSKIILGDPTGGSYANEYYFDEKTLAEEKKEQKKKIIDERGKSYGRKEIHHPSTGKMWSGILSQWTKSNIDPLPPHIVNLMFTAEKICRAAHGYKEDNYDDAEIYLKFAKEFQENFEPQEDT